MTASDGFWVCEVCRHENTGPPERCGQCGFAPPYPSWLEEEVAEESADLPIWFGVTFGVIALIVGLIRFGLEHDTTLAFSRVALGVFVLTATSSAACLFIAWRRHARVIKTRMRWRERYLSMAASNPETRDESDRHRTSP